MWYFDSLLNAFNIDRRLHKILRHEITSAIKEDTAQTKCGKFEHKYKAFCGYVLQLPDNCSLWETVI